VVQAVLSGLTPRAAAELAERLRAQRALQGRRDRSLANAVTVVEVAAGTTGPGAVLVATAVFLVEELAAAGRPPRTQPVSVESEERVDGARP
jgi:hypothetical protein